MTAPHRTNPIANIYNPQENNYLTPHSPHKKAFLGKDGETIYLIENRINEDGTQESFLVNQRDKSAKKLKNITKVNSRSSIHQNSKKRIKKKPDQFSQSMFNNNPPIDTNLNQYKAMKNPSNELPILHKKKFKPNKIKNPLPNTYTSPQQLEFNSPQINNDSDLDSNQFLEKVKNFTEKMKRKSQVNLSNSPNTPNQNIKKRIKKGGVSKSISNLSPYQNSEELKDSHFEVKAPVNNIQNSQSNKHLYRGSYMVKDYQNMQENYVPSFNPHQTSQNQKQSNEVLNQYSDQLRPEIKDLFLSKHTSHIENIKSNPKHMNYKSSRGTGLSNSNANHSLTYTSSYYPSYNNETHTYDMNKMGKSTGNFSKKKNNKNIQFEELSENTEQSENHSYSTDAKLREIFNKVNEKNLDYLCIDNFNAHNCTKSEQKSLKIVMTKILSDKTTKISFEDFKNLVI